MNRFALLIIAALTNPISTGRIHAEIDILNAAEKEVSVLHVSLVMVCGDSGQRSGTYDASKGSFLHMGRAQLTQNLSNTLLVSQRCLERMRLS